MFRTSFRDPPTSFPAHLVVEATGESPPARCTRVAGLAVHPLAEGRWVLELDLGSGPAGFIETSPAELFRRCQAGIGPAHLSHRGVETPGLLFEGLPVRR